MAKAKTWPLPDGEGQGPRPNPNLPKNPFGKGGGLKVKKLQKEFNKGYG